MADYVLSVKVTGDAADFEKTMKEAGATLENIRRQTEGTGFGKISDQIKKVGSSMKSVGQSMTNSITKPARNAAIAVGGITLAKGWARMTEIDAAKAKLKALGVTASEMKTVNESVMASVKGTAFALNEGYSTAAGAMAAGIKAGSQLTNYLDSVAGAAALAGTSMEEMGHIFNKAATSGRVTNEVLNQMRDAGLDIDTALAKSMGVARSEIFELASQGKIDFETFRKAAEDAFGGVAQSVGNATITGALSNLWASIGRVGEAFLGTSDNASTFAGRLKGYITQLTDVIDNIQPKIAEYGQTFGQTFGAIINYLQTGSVAFQGMNDDSRAAFETLRPLLDSLRNVDWASVISGAAAMVTTVLIPMATMIGNVVQLLAKLPTGVQSAILAFALFGGPALTAIGTISTMLGSVVGLLGKFGGKSKPIADVGNAAGGAAPKVSALGKNLLVAGGAVALIGVGVAAAGAGFYMMANAATSLASAGGAAIAVFFGMIAAFAGLIVVVGALGPVSIAAGAAIALVGAGLALAGAGALMLGVGIKKAAEGLKIVAKYGTTAAKGIVAIGTAAKGLKLSSLLKLGGLAAEFRTLGNSSQKAATSLKSIMSSAKSAGSAFGSLKSSASSNVSAAGKIVDNFKKKVEAIGKLKPKVNIGVGHVPHFSVSWNTHSKNGTTVSTPSISYWAKGAIFTGPSLLAGGNVVGDGRGPEAVAPIDVLQSYVTEAVEKSDVTNGGNNYYFGDITLEVSSLEDVTTIEQIADVFRRAKAFA